MNIDEDVKYVKGVGPNRVKLLNKLGIFTLKDLITYYPRGYEDRSNPKKIYECMNGEMALIEVVAMSKLIDVKIGKGRTMQKLVVGDESGKATMVWFNQPYLKSKFYMGKKYRFFGKIEVKYGYQMNSPTFDEIEETNNTGKIIPIYPLTFSLTQNTLRKIIENGLEKVKENGGLKETIPGYILNEYKLEEINKANYEIHFPANFDEFKRARKRLVFDELLATQLALLEIKDNNLTDEKGVKFDSNIQMSDVINTLPFNLTKVQLKVLQEIDENMESEKPMNRLLQGDVGSGKTIVSIIASYKAVKSGYQVAILAPTAILATQHLENFKRTLEKFDIKCELLISGIKKKEKDSILERLENGDIDIIIGTHALLEENVKFKNLGFVVTDEQHRFGVKQRATIAKKGQNPDVLVMSATPIPRTLALILYGDLDISIIDELPPNRKQIETYAVTPQMSERINNFIKKQVDEGRQAYIVCPLVEDSEEEDMDLQSVKTLYEDCKNNIFPNYRVEYIHGKMKPKEKDEIMTNFKNGEIDILISTTVIEVGVDVPNASIMVIEDAQRFGLAQLHQLRGRVGRRRV